jgi:UDP-N-acetyl-D-galactosamine dehydrogenase
MTNADPSLPALDEVQLGIVGLGYVGLPLAVAFARILPTVGFDINPKRIVELKLYQDHTREIDADDLKSATHLVVTHQLEDLRTCNVYIITVPTPIDEFKRPDFAPLLAASETIAKVIKRGDVVIYESTVYPGATEEICVPVIESLSNLKLNVDFSVGYSPERINPGDSQHRLTDIKKVTSGSNPQATDFIDALYRRIIKAGTFKASSIRVAEAAKVIENTQRDVNIALINELAIIFDRLGIDTEEVLRAAATKWNFLHFKPGLVGGHCIGVDPYYLTHKAQQIGYHPEVILAGRRINDEMGSYVANRVIKLMLQRRIHIAQSRILVMGLTFKENCPDLRNTRVVDLIHEFSSFDAKIDIYDPWVDPKQAQHEYNFQLCTTPESGAYDAIVLAVAHQSFIELGSAGIRRFAKPNGIIFDVKHILPKETVDGRL